MLEKLLWNRGKSAILYEPPLMLILILNFVNKSKRFILSFSTSYWTFHFDSIVQEAMGTFFPNRTEIDKEWKK